MTYTVVPATVAFVSSAEDELLARSTEGPGCFVIRTPEYAGPVPTPPPVGATMGTLALTTTAYGAPREVTVPYQKDGRAVTLYLPDVGSGVYSPTGAGFDLGVLPVELRPDRPYSAPCFVLGGAAYTPTSTRVLAYGEVYPNGYITISSNGNGNGWPNAGTKELVSFVLPYLTAEP